MTRYREPILTPSATMETPLTLDSRSSIPRFPTPSSSTSIVGDFTEIMPPVVQEIMPLIATDFLVMGGHFDNTLDGENLEDFSMEEDDLTFQAPGNFNGALTAVGGSFLDRAGPWQPFEIPYNQQYYLPGIYSPSPSLSIFSVSSSPVDYLADIIPRPICRNWKKTSLKNFINDVVIADRTAQEESFPLWLSSDEGHIPPINCQVITFIPKHRNSTGRYHYELNDAGESVPVRTSPPPVMLDPRYKAHHETQCREYLSRAVEQSLEGLPDRWFDNESHARAFQTIYSFHLVSGQTNMLLGQALHLAMLSFMLTRCISLTTESRSMFNASTSTQFITPRVLGRQIKYMFLKVFEELFQDLRVALIHMVIEANYKDWAPCVAVIILLATVLADQEIGYRMFTDAEIRQGSPVPEYNINETCQRMTFKFQHFVGLFHHHFASHDINNTSHFNPFEDSKQRKYLDGASQVLVDELLILLPEFMEKTPREEPGLTRVEDIPKSLESRLVVWFLLSFFR